MVIALALLAALLFALAGAAEQRAATRLPSPASARTGPARTGPARTATAGRVTGRHRARPADRFRHRLTPLIARAAALVRSPLWMAGWGADALGFAVQARAVHIGSLSVVQPLLVTTLLFSLPLGMLGTRRAPQWSDWAGALAACAGLAMVLSGRQTAATGTPQPARLVACVLLVAVVAAGLVLVTRARPLAGRAVPLAVAAGMMFALGAAFTKLVAGSLASHGVVATAGYPPAYALLAASIAGLVLQQAAFSAGTLAVTMTAMTITDPLVSYVLGIVGFGEPAPRGTGSAALTLVGLAALAAGVAVLARSPLLRGAGPSAMGAAGPLDDPATAPLCGQVLRRRLGRARA